MSYAEDAVSCKASVFAVENHDASERQLCRTQRQRSLKHQQQPPNMKYGAKRPRMNCEGCLVV